MRRSHIYLALIVLLFFAWAARKEAEMWLYSPDGDISKMLGPGFFFVPFMLLLFLWVRADSKGRGLKPPLAASILVPVVFPVGVPYYYFKTYALRSAFAHVGLAVLFVAVCFGAGRLGNEVAFNYYYVWTNHPPTGPQGAVLTYKEVFDLANLAAKSHGADLAAYWKPSLSYDGTKSQDQWSASFSLKGEDKPGGHFTVIVDDHSKRITFVPGE